MTDARDFVLQLIEKKARLPENVDLDSLNYFESGYVDSLGIIKFVVEIENFYQIEISDSDIESADFKTVGGLVSLVRRKVASRKSA
jgi:acyl carrier protein